MNRRTVDRKLKVLTLSIGISTAPFDAATSKQLLENAPLYKQVRVKWLSKEQILDHCEKKYIDIVFKDYYQYIPQLKSFPSSFWSIYVLHFVLCRSLYIHFI